MNKKIKHEIIECTEQTKFCMKKFIRTRINQNTVCINCLKTLDILDDHPLPVSKTRRNLWS